MTHFVNEREILRPPLRVSIKIRVLYRNCRLIGKDRQHLQGAHTGAKSIPRFIHRDMTQQAPAGADHRGEQHVKWVPFSFMPLASLRHRYDRLDSSPPLVLLLKRQEVALALPVLLFQQAIVSLERMQDLLGLLKHVQRQASCRHTSQHSWGTRLLLHNTNEDGVEAYCLLNSIGHLFQNVFKRNVCAQLLTHS